ncbi:MAG: hypothetical protein ACYDDU_03065 [Dermatophilaceae bacterium]
MSAQTQVDRANEEGAASTAHSITREPRWMIGVLALLALGLTVRVGTRAVGDPDIWWHLKTGQYVLNGGHFSGPDPWVPFATRPFVLTQWLPEVVAQKVYEFAGLPGVAWLRSAAMLVLLGTLLWACRRVADTVPALMAALAAMLGAGASLTERPQLVSFILLAVTLAAWWRSAEDLRPRWWLIPLTWVWACSHGLWPVGLAVGGVVILGLAVDRRLSRRTALRLMLVPALSLVAAALTPVGPRLLLSAFDVSSAAGPFVQEWQPTSARNPFALITLSMIALVVLTWVRSRSVPPTWQILLATTAFVATLIMFRTVAIGAVIAAPLFANALQQQRFRPPKALTRQAAFTWLGLSLVAALIAMPMAGAVAQKPFGVPDRLRPQLAALPAKTVVLDQFAISGWLLWAEPHLIPVVDLRSEVYSSEYLTAYRNNESVGPGWQSFITRTGATTALLSEDSALADALQQQLRWRVTGRDNGYVLLESI